MTYSLSRSQLATLFALFDPIPIVFLLSRERHETLVLKAYVLIFV